MIASTPDQAARPRGRRPAAPQNASAIEQLRTRLHRLERQLARVERLCGTALEDLGLLQDDLADTDPGRVDAPWPSLTRRRSRALRAACVASTIDIAPGRLTVVAGGVLQEVRVSALQVELVTLLAAPTGQSHDQLVGFKPLPLLVHALRRHHPTISRRSVIVAVSRLRHTLGPVYASLVETARGTGYRFRVVASESASARVDR